LPVAERCGAPRMTSSMLLMLVASGLEAAGAAGRERVPALVLRTAGRAPVPRVGRDGGACSASDSWGASVEMNEASMM